MNISYSSFQQHPTLAIIFGIMVAVAVFLAWLSDQVLGDIEYSEIRNNPETIIAKALFLWGICGLCTLCVNAINSTVGILLVSVAFTVIELVVVFFIEKALCSPKRSSD